MDRITSEKTKSLLEAIIKKHVNKAEAISESELSVNQLDFGLLKSVRKYPFEQLVCNETYQIKAEKYHFHEVNCGELGSDLLSVLLVYNVEDLRIWETTIQDGFEKMAMMDEFHFKKMVKTEKKTAVQRKKYLKSLL